jgi:3-deoxy-D-manno-octulosonate 8-phosphate phosphatase (KDO 8-P phosphatase)
MRDLKAEAIKYADQLKKIKVCAFDVDGVLTDGKVWWAGEEIGWNRATNIRDGYGLVLLKRLGYKVGVITGGDSLSVVKRFEENLKLDFVYSGNEDKREAYKDLLSKGYDKSEILYMGDEHFDMPLLKVTGFSATVPQASHEVKEVVDYITECPGGEGAVREVIDLLRLACNITPQIPEFDI